MNEKMGLQYSVQEKGIHLEDLIWKLIYSWRLVLVFGVLSACLLTGVKYVRDTKNQTVDHQTDVESLWSGLTKQETLSLEQAIIENKSIEQQLINNTEYQKNSILMNIDPYNQNQVVLQYYVDTNYTVNLNEDFSKDDTQDLIRSYKIYLLKGNIMENAVQEMNVADQTYLAELISLDVDLTAESDWGGDAESLPNHIFCVAVTGRDMEQAKAITEWVKHALEEYQSELSAKIASHELILIDSHEQVVQNRDLAEKQANVETANYNLRLQQESLKTKLSAHQLQVMEQERNNELSGENITDISSVKVGISKKYAVLGFLAGMFLACVLIILKYLMDTHIKTDKELQEFYGLRIFGSIEHESSSKKPFSFVDKWLNCMSGRKKGILQEQLEMTITNLLVTCQKFETKKVFFTTSIRFSEEEQKTIDHIMGQMAKQGIETVFENNVTRNAKALVQMSEIGEVVLLEKLRQTEYQELERELRLCQDQDANLLGMIVIR